MLGDLAGYDVFVSGNVHVQQPGILVLRFAESSAKPTTTEPAAEPTTEPAPECSTEPASEPAPESSAEPSAFTSS